MIRHPVGLARGEVRVAPSDSRWPHLFQLAAEELCTALGSFRGAIEHIGSTAVPGLDAKPIID